MGLHVNTNLALELPVELGRPLQAPARDARAELAAQFIPAGARVLDLSRAKTLERYLPNGCAYRSVATNKRNGGGDFPTQAAAQSDIIVMLGALEYVADLEGLFTHLRFARHDVVLSYHATNLTQDDDRAARGFVNHLSFYDLTLLFDRYGFRIACTAPIDETQMLMRLTPAERLKSFAPCSVAVVSDSDGSDFGGRLGLHMINALLPGEAEVHHLTFRTLHEAREAYDLVVLGTGNSLLQPLMSDALLDVAERGKASIGIFGTQYRELLPRPVIDRLLDRLDVWYARNEDDALMYGRGRTNVVHLGDWLIDQFPLTRASADEPLEIDGEMGDVALDRAIKTIQTHRQVYSSRLAPFLCALTAANYAAYAEAPAAHMPDVRSGSFRSLLIDVFGRSFPEKQFFMVDRDAVARYKARVHRNVAELRLRIEMVLANVAVAAG
jgi:hypothetical protein